MVYVITGGPATGKGTRSDILSKALNIPHISTGDILRDVAQTNEKINKKLSRGELISDEIITELLEERLSKEDCKDGFILDGYPRYMAQVDAVNETIKELGLTIDYAVLLNVDYETALKRTLGRVICPNCKRTYNKLTGVCKPINDNMCDDCNIELTTRGDDNEESFKKGFETYQKITLPVAEYYKEKGMLIELNSNNDADYTFNEFKSKVEK